MNGSRFVLLVILLGAGTWTPPARAQASEQSAKARTAQRNAAFAEVEGLIDSVRRTPPNSRGRLLDRLTGACARFIDEHLGEATPEQLTRVASTWLPLASDEAEDPERRRRLVALSRAEGLPPDLRRHVRVQVARLTVKVGTKAPAWRVPAAEAKGSISRADVTGKLTLLVFWSPSDPTWREFSARKLHPLHERFVGHEPFAMVSVAACETRDELRRALAEQSVPGQLAFDPKRSCATTMGVAEAPFLVLIDEDHTVLALGPAWRSAEHVSKLLADRLEAGEER